MSLIALKVCLIGTCLEAAAVPLSTSLCPLPDDDDDVWNSSVSYRLVSLAEKKPQCGYGYVHCTIDVLCARATDVQAIKDAVRAIWLKHKEAAVAQKEMLLLSHLQLGPVVSTMSNGSELRLPSIALERSSALWALHDEVVETLKPFIVNLGSMDVGKSAFHKRYPVSDSAWVRAMISYHADAAGDAYAPHITLGASPVTDVEQLTFFHASRVPWRECRLVVSHMGNYCSCSDLLI